MFSSLFLPTIILIFLAIFSSHFSGTESLEAIEVARFPEPICFLNYFYDGQSDSIYFFGGFLDVFEDTKNYDIFSYSISNNTLEVIGQFPKDLNFAPNIHIFPSSNSSDTLYYIVPLPSYASSLVFKFNITDGSSIQIGTIPVSLEFSAYTTGPNREIYIFGGQGLGDQIMKVDWELSDTVQHEIVGTLQQSFWNAVSTKVRDKTLTG